MPRQFLRKCYGCTFHFRKTLGNDCTMLAPTPVGFHVAVWLPSSHRAFSHWFILSFVFNHLLKDRLFNWISEFWTMPPKGKSNKTPKEAGTVPFYVSDSEHVTRKQCGTSWWDILCLCCAACSISWWRKFSQFCDGISATFTMNSWNIMKLDINIHFCNTVIKSLKYMFAVLERIHKISAVWRSDGHQIALRWWYIIGHCPSELRQAPGRRQSDHQTETVQSADKFEINFFLRIIWAPSSFWRHRLVTRQRPDDELTRSAMAPKLSGHRPIITFFF